MSTRTRKHEPHKIVTQSRLLAEDLDVLDIMICGQNMGKNWETLVTDEIKYLEEFGRFNNNQDDVGQD